MGRETDLLGLAGVHLVAGRLCLRGWQVASTARGAPRTDLLAQRVDGSSCAIQVKTRSSGDFHVGKGALEAATGEADEWYVLVNCPTPAAWPVFNILPRNHLVAVARVFQAICDSQGKAWKRKVLGEQEFAGYRDRWELLDTQAARIRECHLPRWVTDGLQEFPQPDLGLDHAGDDSA
ncbi:MAG: hypothetical protein ACRD45_16830 [Bryobacteraceae bacterium]